MSGTGHTVLTQSDTGISYIDGLFSGVKWGDATIYYSWPSSNGEYDYSGGPTSGFGQITAAMQTATHQILNTAYVTPAQYGFTFEGFTNTNSVYTTGTDAHIRLAQSDDPGTAYAYYPDTNDWGGDVFFGRVYDYTNPVQGNYAYHTHIHEIGHALGLQHGQDGLPSNWDSMEFTVMTYRSYIGAPLSGYTNETWGYAQTWMMLDIAALQQMYGANFTVNSGNTVYSWDPSSGNTYVNGEIGVSPGANRIFATIWDGGGTDTYDLSAYSTNLVISLYAGAYSKFSDAQLAYLGDGNYSRGNIFNALLYNGDTRSLIENAIGGSGNDSIGGNQANNVLTGNGGNDYFYAYEGSDVTYGGAGSDVAYGYAGIDYLYGGSDVDYGYGMEDADYVYGGDGNDYGYGGDGGDFVIGDGGSDVVLGEAGNDYLYGGTGVDYTYGGTGSDTSYGGADADFMYGGDANDTSSGDDGNDNIYGDAGDDYGYGGNGIDRLFGGSGVDALYGGVSNDSLFGGADVDYLFGDAGNDAMYGEDGSDYLYGGDGFDQMQGNNGQDLMYGGNQADRMLGFNDGDWLYGDNGNDQLFAGLGNDYNYGGDGNDTIWDAGGYDNLNGGLGNDLLIGGTNWDIYTFTGDWGDDIIRGFEQNNAFEDIVLTGSLTISSYADLVANHMTQVGANVVIDDLLGNTITIENVLLANMDATNFVF
jgi:serralysin